MAFLDEESGQGSGKIDTKTLLFNSDKWNIGVARQPLEPLGLRPVMESNWRRDCIRAARSREACKAGGQ